MAESCNSTNCSLNSMQQLEDEINTHCEPVWKDDGTLQEVRTCNNSNCLVSLQQWMDHCMCIPEYCGWKGADPSGFAASRSSRKAASRSRLPPGVVQRLDDRIQQVDDWCGYSDFRQKRLKCPPVDSPAYLSDIDYDCRFTGTPQYSIWAAQFVNDGESAPEGGWRTSSFPPGSDPKPGLGPGCRWDNNCNQVCGHANLLENFEPLLQKGECCDSNRQCSSKSCSMFDTKCWDGTCGLTGCVIKPPDFGMQETKKWWGVCQ